jgi:alpha-tubulin suppressor-like RCC1 family protein
MDSQQTMDSVACWGANWHGQLGDGNYGSPFSSSVPIEVNMPSGKKVISLSIGYQISCATLDDGTAVCWGGMTSSTTHGFTPSTIPTNVNLSSDRTALSVSAGRSQFCVLQDNGSAICGGVNTYGQIGDGTTIDRISPVYLNFSYSLKLGDTDKDGDGTVDWLDDYLDNPIRSVKCSEGSYGRYVCVEASAGNYVGSSGFMSQTECSVGTYQPSTGQSSCLDASAGYYVSSAGATSQIACQAGTYNPSTGGNSSAACIITPAGFYSGAGAGSPTPCDAGTYQPNSGSTSGACLDASAGYYVPITGVINAGYHHTCAIDYLGELYCWGANENGILGQNDSGEASDQDALHNSNTPLNVSFGPGRTAVSVSMGYSHTCAILDNGSVNCWGQGQHTGTGSGSYVPIYTPLGTGRTAIAIDSGQLHTCAILDDGSLKCWGYNNNGQIANNSAVYYNGNPVEVYLGAGRTAVNISLGNYHTCVILDDSSLKCWGENIYGQLGDGTTTDTCTDDWDSQGNQIFTCENNASTASAIDLGTGRYAVAVSAGKQHTCAILDDGSMKCWGANGNGKLGDGTSTQRLTPVAVSFSASFTISKISAGGSHTCAIMSDESLFCWGYGDYIGVGEYQCEDWNSGANDLCYTPVSLNLSAKEVSLGNEHTCAILDDANFWCWGDNSEYQLGTSNSSSDENYEAWIPEQTLMPTMAFGASFQTACPTGTYNPNNGSTSSSFCLEADTGHYVDSTGSANQIPCAVGTYQPSTGQSSCIDASAGYYVDTTGSTTQTDADAGYYVPSTGSATQTACAAGTYQPSTGQSSCIDASAGYYVDTTGSTTQTACSAVTYNPNTASTSSSACIGASAGYYVQNNSYYETDYNSHKISSGNSYSCVILDDGSVSCWGTGLEGQLGDGTVNNRSTPAQTSSLGVGRTAVAISAWSSHTCAILDDGSVSCWGGNYYGQLGDGTLNDSLTPTQTSSLGVGRTAVAISVGGYHTCAILDDGSVSCWGRNNHGQLGDGTQNDRLTPTQTSSLGVGRTAVAISAGSYHTCAILDDGSVSCWGNNAEGQLGDGTQNDRLTPTQTSSFGVGRTAVAISAGTDHTCAMLDNSSVSCWGKNTFGQLGDGTQNDRLTPTQTSSLGVGRTAVIISAGYYHTCAILDNESVSCWGKGDEGQLGDGTSSGNRLTPTQTSSLGVGRTAAAISAGLEHTCATLDNGSVSCWGRNYVGSLGDGTQTDRLTPTQTSSLGAGRTAAIATIFYEHTGQASQTPCAVGTYQPSTGQSSCIDASAGYYVDTTASTTQTSCPNWYLYILIVRINQFFCLY